VVRQTNPIYTGLTSGEAGFQSQQMAEAAKSIKTWKTKADCSRIAMQSLKTMNEEQNE
jgi:hypothetical protein